MNDTEVFRFETDSLRHSSTSKRVAHRFACPELGQVAHRFGFWVAHRFSGGGRELSRSLVIPTAIALAFLLASMQRAFAAEKPPSGDAAWYDQESVAEEFPPRYEGELRDSRYLTMRDGCKIAVEVFVPKGLKPDDKVPAILHQTRYWRSVVFKPPLDKVRDPERLMNVRRFFVPRGYAWLSVDARGSGASFGHRACAYSPDEVRDGAEIVDWIIEQPWSDGQVIATGVSYDGGTAEMLATNKHPAVKAIAPLFSMFDPYQEVAYPGGVHLSWFTQVWGSLGQALDRNTIPDLVIKRFGPSIKMLCEGVRPVGTDTDGSLLAEAIREHRYNWKLHETALKIACRDDRIPYDWTLGFDTLSPYVHAKAIDACGVAVYSYSAWFDAAFAHSAIQRHLTLTNPKNRLILGPWNHGGRRNCSPHSFGKARFDMPIELFRFFEHHLRGADTGLAAEKPVHYFTMGEERWKAADTWPPPSKPRTLYLAQDGVLSADKASAEEASDEHRFDYTHGTGEHSRWNCLVMGGPVVYPDRVEQDQKLLCYTTEPLREATEVTGHPIVALHMTWPTRDGNVLVYLEDIWPDRKIRLISEGVLRAVHRKRSDEPPPYKLLVPYHTFRRADMTLLTPGELAELTFDLLPTSYLFKKGHRIRIAIAGADVDHFATPPGPPPTVKVHRSAKLASHVVLPVVTRP